LKNGDCNKWLKSIDKRNWLKANWRGVVFLDPFAMDLTWESLTHIRNTQALDLWYLFPFYALNRNLYKNGIIPESNKKSISMLLGTDAWERDIYSMSLQMNLFGETALEKTDTDGLKEYIIKRLEETFPTVSKKAVIFRNDKNAPIFLLCFAGSNPSARAKSASLNVADYILTKL